MNSAQQSSTKNIPQKNGQHEVLFQKLGNTWFAFSEIDNSMIYSMLPDGVDPRSTKLELYHVIEEHLAKVEKAYRKPMRKSLDVSAA